MKKFITKILPWIIILAMFIVLIPTFITRLENEKLNKNVTISLLYNDIANKVSEKKLESVLDDCLDEGIDVITLMEDDLNGFVNRGDITCIKYNVLRHKYDDESIRIADFIGENCADVSYDSHIVLVKRADVKERFRKEVPLRYTRNEFRYIGEAEGIDLYVYFDGRIALSSVSVGFNEDVIKELTDKGFKIALSYKVKGYSTLKYLNDLDRIIKEYNVPFINLRGDTKAYFTEKPYESTYEGIADIINNNDMTLILTENQTQLGNESTIGFDEIMEAVTGKNGSNKVVRAYESYDDANVDYTYYKHKVTQYFNSTIDRNIRFIVGTQISLRGIYEFTYDDLADRSLRALVNYKNEIQKEGFTVNQDVQPFDYSGSTALASASALAIMIMLILIMINILSGKYPLLLSVIAYLGALAGFAITLFIMPNEALNERFGFLETILSLYPSVYCLVMACFVITMLFAFVKTFKDKLSAISLSILSVVVTLVTLLLNSVVLGSLLSGLDLYINNAIFRGIKLSLTIPLIYAVIAFYILFFENKIKLSKAILIDYFKKIINFQILNIKIYWIALAAVIFAVVRYYLIRSGNVNTISSFEASLRNFLTDVFSARPRTKEFLIGYPGIVIFAYYMKKSNIPIIQGLLAVAASILAASVTNSFCHVFTDYTTIVSRTINGLIVGAILSIVIYVVNIYLLRLVKYIFNRFFPKVEIEKWLTF